MSRLNRTCAFALFAVLLPAICFAQEGETSLPAKAEKPGWLGVGLRNLDDVERAARGVDHPVVAVRHVFRGSPAEQAGFQSGDVILAVGDTDLSRGVKEMVAHVQSHSEGSEVFFRVSRQNEVIQLKAVLDTYPDRKKLLANEWVGEPLPKLALRDLQTDKVLELNSPDIRVLVLEYWATWCGPCKRAAPRLERLYEQHSHRGLQIVGVTDEEREIVEVFERNRPFDYTVAIDPERSFSSKLYATSMPTFVVVDGDGLIQWIGTGLGNVGAVEKKVLELLE